MRVDFTPARSRPDGQLYAADTISAWPGTSNLKVEAGTQAPFNSNCTGFAAQQTLFDAALSTFPTSYAGGVSDFPASESSWDNGESVVYRFTATLNSNTPDSQQGASTGLHTFRWEAQNQP